MIGVLAAGAVTGLGVALLGYGLHPPRPPFADIIQALRRPPSPPRSARQRLYTALAHPLSRVGLPHGRVRAYLTLLDQDPVQHLAEQTVRVLTGALVLPATAALAGARGQIPIWLALLVGALAWRWGTTRIHQQAQQRRAQLRATLSAILDLLSIGLAGGAGLEQALDDAAAACTGWAAARVQQAVATSRLLRQPPWPALAQLGADTNVGELQELAASMTLAGREGARIRASLTARATALRAAATTEMETAAENASARMAMPLLLLGTAYLIFLLYPPIATIGNHL